MRRLRSGVSAMLLLLALPLLLLFLAFVIDLGTARVVWGQLRSAADLAALAGAGELDGTALGAARAEAVALHVASRNRAHGEAVALGPGDVEVGVWDGGSFAVGGAPEELNAVRVRARHDGLVPFFGRAVGLSEPMAASVASIARRGRDVGAGGVPYYLPFALPDCVPREHTGDEIADMEFSLAPGGADTAGWGLIGGSTSASAISDHLDAIATCMEEWLDTGVVSRACTPVVVGDEVDLNNGVAASALDAVADAIEAYGAPWDAETFGDLPAQHEGSAIDPDLYGQAIVGPLPIFDAGDEWCATGGTWNETLPVIGFVWAAIYDVRTKGAASQKNVWLKVDITHVHPIGDGFGGGSWGVITPGPPWVVR